MSAEGALRFGRYAFPPNALGYCGPEDHQALLGYVASHRADQGLVELERRFEGAFPYLRLIAHSNGLADPFDESVVEAYWLGNRLLRGVDTGAFQQSLSERFRPRMDARTFAWLAGKPAGGAVPHHNFHVFEVYTRSGLMRAGGPPAPVLEVMDQCRVSWGKVVSAGAGHLVVARRPLAIRSGKLALDPPRPVTVETYGDGALPGDWVSMHWSWACEILSAAELRRLRLVTQSALQLAGGTM